MSRESTRVETERLSEFQTSVVELWRRWYDVPVIAMLAGFMLWVRLQGYDRFVRDGTVFFSGNDAYYHFRQVSFTVRNWPWTMPFDPWTRFPTGTSADHFGTLFDQIIATVALIVGLGSPDQQTVASVTLIAPAVFGAAVVIPVYYIGQRLGGRLGGIFGVLILALLPGTFLQRSVVGFSDHHMAEVLFQSISVAAIMVALGVAERELPVYEQLLDRDWAGLRDPVTWSAVAGVAIALYMWTWPPAVFFVGVLGLFFLVALTIDYVRGRSPEHLAFVGVVSMAVALPLLLVKIDTIAPQTTGISATQFVLVIGLAAGCAFLAGLARVWDSRDIDERLYPATVGGIVVVGVGVLSVVAPDIFGLIRSNLERIVLFSQSKGTLTIAEAQSVVPQGPTVTLGQQLSVASQFMYSEYGLAYVTAFLGLIWMVAHLYYRTYRSEDVFLIIYTVFTLLMALTQARFNYYLVVPIAVLNAWLFGRIVDVVGVPSMTDSLGDIEVYQVLTLLALLVVVIAPMAPPLAADTVRESQQTGVPPDVVTAGDAYARPSGVSWANSTSWMQNNTPAVGNYGGAGNSDQLSYYGTYPRSDDFAYPEGAYGVMSWWDYGHWITVQARRIPVANPFQQNPRAASAFFQAQNETTAELILETLPAMKGRSGEYDELSTAELREIEAGLSAQQDAEDTQYVMIDDETAGQKFYAVAQWSGPASRGDTRTQDVYMRGQRYRVGNQNITASTYNEKYEETMIYRLYFEDAQGLSHYRLVHEHDSYSIVGGFTDGQDSTALTARSLRQGWSEQLANVSRQLSQLRRFGGAANFGRGLFVYNSHVESDLKTFERVPGATVTGTVRDATENTSVVVAVEMETNTGRTFTYTQRASTADDGSFQITVPYATTNEVMPADGGTDTAVTATGEYRLFVSGAGPFPTRVANFSVPEPAVYDGGTVDVGTVEVPEPDQPDGNGNTSERIGSPTSIPTPTPTPTPAPDPSVSLAPGGGPASGVTVASGPSPPDGAIADPAR